MDRESVDIFSLSIDGFDADNLRFLVIRMVNAKAAVKIVLYIDICRWQFLLIRQFDIIHTLQGENSLPVVVIIRLCHQIPSLFPCTQEVWNQQMVFMRLLIKLIVFALDTLFLVDGLQDDLHIFHACRCLSEHDLLTMFQGQFRHSFDMIGREQIVVKGIILAI